LIDTRSVEFFVRLQNEKTALWRWHPPGGTKLDEGKLDEGE